MMDRPAEVFGAAHIGPHAEDRELRCVECAGRMFSSRAAALLEGGIQCWRCHGPLELVPAEHQRRL